MMEVVRLANNVILVVLHVMLLVHLHAKLVQVQDINLEQHVCAMLELMKIMWQFVLLVTILVQHV